jgi:HEAT repeat protein
MKRALLIVPLFAVALAAGADATQTPRAIVQPTLVGIEDVPTQPFLDALVSGDASPTLRDIADDPIAPPTARLRAFVALGQYTDATTIAFLSSHVVSFTAAKTGEQTLFLRAAARSLALTSGAAAVDQLAGLLDHAVPDVRADAAAALAATGSLTALPALRSHLLRETNDLVHLALVEAIRQLTHS